MAMSVSNVITAFVAILIGVVLTPIVYNQANAINPETNLSYLGGTTATVVALIPTFFALGVLILSIRNMVTSE
jgi:hypothetical protein